MSVHRVFVQDFLEWDTGLAMPQHVWPHTLTRLVLCIWWKEAAEEACSAPPSALPKMSHLESQDPVPVVARKGGGAWAVRRFDGSLFTFCFVLSLSLGTRALVRVIPMVPCKHLSRAFSQKETYLVKFSHPHTGILEFLLTCPLPDHPAYTAGPLLGCGTFPLAHQCGSSVVPIDSNWVGTLSNMLFLEDGRWGLECGVAVLKGEGLQRDYLWTSWEYNCHLYLKFWHCSVFIICRALGNRRYCSN